jgi:hypothetical protein
VNLKEVRVAHAPHGVSLQINVLGQPFIAGALQEIDREKIGSVGRIGASIVGHDLHMRIKFHPAQFATLIAPYAGWPDDSVELFRILASSNISVKSSLVQIIHSKWNVIVRADVGLGCFQHSNQLSCFIEQFIKRYN